MGVKIVSLDSRLVKKILLWWISKWLFFSPFARGSKRFFSNGHYEKLIELLKVKVIKVWRPLCDWVPWSIYLWDVSKLSLLQFMNHTAQVFLTMVLVPVEVGSLYLSICFFKLCGSFLWELTSLADLKRVDFSVSSAFHLLLGGVTISQLLIHWT